MSKIDIDEFTDQIIPKERFFAYQIWKTASQRNIPLSKQEIEDILSDAYLGAVTKIRNEKSLNIEYPLAWFAKIVFLTCMNYLRKKSRHNTLISSKEIKELNAMNFIYETIDQNMSNELLRSLINKHLTEDEKKVIDLNVKGYSYQEISNLLNKPIFTVRQVRSRALKKLNKLLN